MNSCGCDCSSDVQVTNGEMSVVSTVGWSGLQGLAVAMQETKGWTRSSAGLTAAQLLFVWSPPSLALSDAIALLLVAELADLGISVTHFSLG